MKKAIKTIFYLFDLLLISTGLFYFWAKSTNLDEDKYAELNSYPFNEKAPKDQYKIITYNIGYMSGMANNQAVRPTKEFYNHHLQKVKKLLGNEQPDIVAFQEIDFDSKRSYHNNQHDSLAHALEMPFGASAINWDKRYVPFPYFPPTVHFGKIVSGQSILSSYPITGQQRIVLEKVDSQPFYYKAMYIDRLAQVAKVLIGEREIIIINVHTEAFDQHTRINQIHYIYQLFKKYAQKYPVILLGDFNTDSHYKDTPIHLFYDDTNIGSACPAEKLSSQETLTYPTDKPIEQLDYIFFTNKDISSVEWKVLREFDEISDHFPVAMTFTLK